MRLQFAFFPDTDRFVPVLNNEAWVLRDLLDHCRAGKLDSTFVSIGDLLNGLSFSSSLSQMTARRR